MHPFERRMRERGMHGLSCRMGRILACFVCISRGFRGGAKRGGATLSTSKGVSTMVRWVSRGGKAGVRRSRRAGSGGVRKVGYVYSSGSVDQGEGRAA